MPPIPWYLFVLFSSVRFSLSIPTIFSNTSTALSSQLLSFKSNTTTASSSSSLLGYTDVILNAAAHNGSLSDNTDVICDGDAYKIMPAPSCLEAVNEIPDDDKMLTFGERGMGVYDIPLPHRFINCKRPQVWERWCEMADRMSSGRNLLLRDEIEPRSQGGFRQYARVQRCSTVNGDAVSKRKKDGWRYRDEHR